MLARLPRRCNISSSPVTLVELPGIEHAYDMGATALVWAHVRAIEAFLAPLAALGPP